MKISKEDVLTTQLFVVRSILINHTYAVLDPATIEKIIKEIENEITKGPCNWAF